MQIRARGTDYMDRGLCIFLAGKYVQAFGVYRRRRVTVAQAKYLGVERDGLPHESAQL